MAGYHGKNKSDEKRKRTSDENESSMGRPAPAREQYPYLYQGPASYQEPAPDQAFDPSSAPVRHEGYEMRQVTESFGNLGITAPSSSGSNFQFPQAGSLYQRATRFPVFDFSPGEDETLRVCVAMGLSPSQIKDEIFIDRYDITQEMLAARVQEVCPTWTDEEDQELQRWKIKQDEDVKVMRPLRDQYFPRRSIEEVQARFNHLMLLRSQGRGVTVAGGSSQTQQPSLLGTQSYATSHPLPDSNYSVAGPSFSQPEETGRPSNDAQFHLSQSPDDAHQAASTEQEANQGVPATVPRRYEPKHSSRWSREERELLRKWVEEHPGHWQGVEECCPGRGREACRAEWSLMSGNKTFRKHDVWIAEEVAILIQWVEEHPGNWDGVEERLPGRARKACKMKWSHLKASQTKQA